MNPSTSDRSWNDPPVVKYDITRQAKGHHLLKKRIFEEELQASAPSSTKELTDNESKNMISENAVCVINKSNIEALENPVEKTETALSLSDEESLLFVMSVLRKILDETTDKCEKTTRDINKRIGIMEESWNLKLSKEVKDKMFKLAQELEKCNIDAALKIQWSLTMEHVREVKSWVVGIKHIIEMKKERMDSENLQNKDSTL